MQRIYCRATCTPKLAQWVPHNTQEDKHYQVHTQVQEHNTHSTVRAAIGLPMIWANMATQTSNTARISASSWEMATQHVQAYNKVSRNKWVEVSFGVSSILSFPRFPFWDFSPQAIALVHSHLQSCARQSIHTWHLQTVNKAHGKEQWDQCHKIKMCSLVAIHSELATTWKATMWKLMKTLRDGRHNPTWPAKLTFHSTFSTWVPPGWLTQISIHRKYRLVSQ